MSVPVALIEAFELLEPVAQAAVTAAVLNIAQHADPVGAAELAAMVTASRIGSLQIINAALRLKKRAGK